MRRFAWWQVVVTLALGPFLIGLVGSGVVSIIVAFVRLGHVDWQGLGTDPALVTDFSARLVRETQTLPVVATSLVITALGFGVSPFVLARIRRIDGAEALGFRARPHVLALLLAPVGILALGPTSDMLVEFAKRVAPGATLGSLEQINAIARSAPAWVLWPFLALCPGFGEEILFRGFVQRSIGRGRLAITVSALTFAAIHADPHHVLGVIPLGFYLAWVAARTDSTWVSIAAHVTNNTMAVVSMSLMRDRAEEHAGPLAVAAGLGVCALTIAVIARVCPKLPNENVEEVDFEIFA